MTSSGQRYRTNGIVLEDVPTELVEEDEENCTSVFHDVMRIRHTFHLMAARVAETFDLQSTEMSALDTLGKFGPLTMGQLAKQSFISPTNTTRTVKNLVERKLVRRERSPTSDREVIVSLTAAGRKVFRKSYPQMVHEVNDLLSYKLTGKERKALAAILAKLVD